MLQHSVLPPGHVTFTPSEETPRYTLLAHAPDGSGALLVHQDQPAHAFWWTFSFPPFAFGIAHNLGLTATYRLAGDPENEFTPPDWVTQFELLGEDEGAGPEFDTIDEVRQYLQGYAVGDGNG